MLKKDVYILQTHHTTFQASVLNNVAVLPTFKFRIITMLVVLIVGI
jgi:hypothetical protein